MTSRETAVKAILKQQLKKCGITYTEIAKELGVSLPTVRRIMTSEKLSFERLEFICDMVGLSFRQLAELLEKPDRSLNFLSEEQDSFLAEFPSFLLFLRYLARGMTIEEISQEFKLDSKQIAFYLQELEVFKFIKRSGDKIKLLIKWPPNFKFPGPVQKKLFDKIASTTIEHLLERTIRDKAGWSKDFYYFIPTFQLTDESYQSFVADQYELYIKYREVSRLESAKLHWSKLKTVTGILGADQFDVFEKALGPIK